MINVHLYPSSFRHESRIFRVANTLSRFGLFDRIELVGVTGEGLAENETVSEYVHILRLCRKRENSGLARKVADALKWGLMVYRRFRKAPVACINCHSVATLPLGCVLKWATGARLVYDAHELETETNGLKGIRKIGTKLVERALIHYADYCVFVGHSINEWYRHEYALRNTAVIYNCPIYQTTKSSDYFRELYEIPQDRPIFLYQGVIDEGRGITGLIGCFAMLEDRAALVIMGYGSLVAWVEREARQHSNIHYHPAVRHDKLLRYTSGADYGLSVIEPNCVSYEYCMPNKLFEYVMAGKPVLVSSTQEQAAFVQRHDVGEVARDATSEAIREAVLRLLSRDMAELASSVERIRREFCWEQQEVELYRIYFNSLGFRPIDRPSL